jgi:hypothetical protein
MHRTDNRSGSVVAIGAYRRAGVVILESRVAAGAWRCERGDRCERQSKSERDFSHHGLLPRWVSALDQTWGQTPSVACDFDMDTRSIRCFRSFAANIVGLLKWSCPRSRANVRKP